MRADNSELDLLGPRPNGHYLAAPHNRHRGEGACPGVEQRLKLRLGEHVGFGPAGKACPGISPEPQQGLSRRVAPFVDGRGLRPPHKIVGDSRGLEDPPDLMVEVDRSWHRVRRGLFFEDTDIRAPLAQQDRQGLTDRPVAHDGDVVALPVHAELPLLLEEDSGGPPAAGIGPSLSHEECPLRRLGEPRLKSDCSRSGGGARSPSWARAGRGA